MISSIVIFVAGFYLGILFLGMLAMARSRIASRKPAIRLVQKPFRDIWPAFMEK
jgi:hypothetical protein